MAGLLGFMAAGAASGAGKGIVAEAQAKREAAIATLADTRLNQREDKDRAFRSQESADDRAFRSQEGGLDRAVTRENQGETLTLDDGSVVRRSGTTVKPVTSADGKPVKTSRSDKDMPADVRTAEWYETATPEQREAFDASRGGIKPADRARLVVDHVKTLKEAALLSGDERTEDELYTAAEEFVDRSLAPASSRSAPSPSTPPEGAEAPAIKRPTDVSKENLIQQAQEAVKNGKDPTAVASTLRSWGIDPKEAGL